jgi:hypothetical protein
MTGPRPPLRPRILRHRGHCGERLECYRIECRAAYRGFRPVEVTATRIFFRCHGSVVPADDVNLKMLEAAS